MPETFYTPPQAAQILGVKSDKVLAWIHAGELVAANLATNANGERPRWRISEEDLGKFLIRRRHIAVPAPEPRRRRRAETAKPYFD
tara:strand:- start:258 stop:515 length:258 start_codon:yes stop_codon:yes gene_type:complete